MHKMNQLNPLQALDNLIDYALGLKDTKMIYHFQKEDTPERYQVIMIQWDFKRVIHNEALVTEEEANAVAREHLVSGRFCSVQVQKITKLKDFTLEIKESN